MKLKLACADFTFPLLSHDKVLDLIQLLEVDGVDIGLFEGRSHLWPSKVFRKAVRAGEELGRKLADRGLRCADVFLQMAPTFIPYAINHPETARRRRAREWFVKTLDYAAAAGSKHVTTLPGVVFEQEKRSESWARAVEELAWRVEQAHQRKLAFGVEAHVGSLAPTPKAALRLVSSVPGLTLTLDYTHFTRIGMPDSAIEPLVPHASHFHARAARKGRLQASFQTNTIDYRGVLRAMKKSGYAGYLGVEYVWIDWEHCNEVDNLSETIQLRDFLRKEMRHI
ncbi:MAG TPA: sugar phosphate isomerase/epimerase [Candidatus Dormibacteraeota bacterium]|nr:sugar phosphate isomerase/epimerase [Candidatus Dormibacteraeota bacterium]